MKKIIFFLFFLLVPVLVFSQVTKTIEKSNTLNGVIKNGNQPTTYFSQSFPNVKIGKAAGASDPDIGRGFIRYDLSSFPANNLNHIYLVELVFDCGNSSTNVQQEVFISLSPIPQIGTNLASDYNSLGITNSTSLLATANNISANTSGIRVPIKDPKKVISDFYNGNKPLNISLLHKNEANLGITISNVKLDITYMTQPTTPTNLRVSNIQVNSCTLAWDAATGGLIKYEVYKDGVLYKTVTSLSENITGLAGGTTYSFSVKAKNDVGTSTPVAMNVTTLTPPVTLTGPMTACPGLSATYTVNNAPSGFTWVKSETLNITSNGNSATVSLKTGTTGTGWIAVYLGTEELIKKNISFIAGNITISGASMVGYLQSETYSVNSSCPFTLDGYYEWELNGTVVGRGVSIVIKSVKTLPKSATIGSIVESNDDPPISKQPQPPGVPQATCQLKVTERSSSGVQITYANKSIVVYGYPEVMSQFKSPYSPDGNSASFITYPNPTSNILNIEIDRDAYMQANSSEQNNSSTVQLNFNPTFDIRLYDGQGNLLRNAKAKDGKVEFNVANLPNGIYYLHIYDGISQKPEMHQIIVEH